MVRTSVVSSNFYCLCDWVKVFFRIVTLQDEKNNMTSLNKWVEVKTDLAGGAPVFRGTRVTVKTLFDYLEEESLEEFLIGFTTVTREQAEGCN